MTKVFWVLLLCLFDDGGTTLIGSMTMTQNQIEIGKRRPVGGCLILDAVPSSLNGSQRYLEWIDSQRRPYEGNIK